VRARGINKETMTEEYDVDKIVDGVEKADIMGARGNT
jgi:dihydroxyacetone kinase-like predicted kinase